MLDNNNKANIHTDGVIEDGIFQDGELQISTHINRSELALGSMAITLSLDNDDIRNHCTIKENKGNTCEYDDKHLMFECKDNGMYNYLIANIKYNSLAIRTSLWIVLRTSYMHTTLHPLESNLMWAYKN